MRASGTLRVGGRTVAVTGESWFDHQWGDYAFDPRAFNWDWFSCRFDDGTELMGYQFRDRDGTAAARARERNLRRRRRARHGDRRFRGDPRRPGADGGRPHLAARLAAAHVLAGALRDRHGAVRRPARPQRDPPDVLGGRRRGERGPTRAPASSRSPIASRTSGLAGARVGSRGAARRAAARQPVRPALDELRCGCLSRACRYPVPGPQVDPAGVSLLPGGGSDRSGHVVDLRG